MNTIEKLIETVSKLSSLEARTEDVMKHVIRVDEKLNNLIDRISRLETKQEDLKENVKNSILADIKGDLARVQFIIDNPKSIKTLRKQSPNKELNIDSLPGTKAKDM